MAARVIHLGMDVCYRLGVLRRAGYEIEECGNLIEFSGALHSGRAADAVMVNDCSGRVPLKAFSIARHCTSAPIILFPNSGRIYEPETIDLIVPSFTPPEEWLLNLAVLITSSMALRAQSAALREASRQLCSETSALCEKSRMERQRTRALLEGTADPGIHGPRLNKEK